MKFDFCKGKKAKYMVSVYGWNVEDRYYVHYFNEAKKLFDEIKEKVHEAGTILSIYDLSKDVQKEFYKY